MNNLNYINDASALRRKTGEQSLFHFAQLYLSHHIRLLPSSAHMEIYTILQSVQLERGKKVAIAAPRDFGKTTMVTLLWIIYSICYHKEDFIVILCHTAQQAMAILENVRTELVENQLLKMDFPEIFESKGRPKPPRWTQTDIITRNGIEILALGSGQQIRGRKYKENRPSVVIMDDLEAGENTFTFEAKEKMKAWLHKSVFKVGSKQTNYLFVGNIFNSFSLLGEVINKDDGSVWIKKKFRALEQFPQNLHLWEKNFNIASSKETFNGETGPCASQKHYKQNKTGMDEEASVLWPQRWSLFELMHEYNEDSVSFASERQNEPRDLSELSMDVEQFHYWTDRFAATESLMEHLGKDVYFAAACDPSMGKSGVRGDYSSIVILACQGKFRYIIEADIARRRPEKLIDDILAYCLRYQFARFSIEANGFQELFVKQLQQRALELSIRTEFVPIINIKDKIGRGQALSAMIKNGYLQFSKLHKQLLDEWRQWPNGKHDDGIDGLEMAVRAAESLASKVIPQSFIQLLKDQTTGQPKGSNDPIGDMLRKISGGQGGTRIRGLGGF